MFSMRHYKAIAQMLKDIKPETNKTEEVAFAQWELTVIKFNREFSNDNPKFKTELFLKACGYK